ncbi:hypothetical protein RND71_024269 [Anisodus tanguticus]|uniref:Uncharacterized protein n=1 Tax=Anisodus tanguticus TaxID=243964 RepID=A0AAE1V3U1_9SOLA|nr:hypothetical protein RND71_024269 [Anisodus tanguticus]
MPAYLLTALVLDRLGRKPLGVGTMRFSGIFCLAGSLMKGDRAWKMVLMVCGVLGIFGGGIPVVVFGICGIAGGFLVLYLPEETINRTLYDTIAGLQEGEAKSQMVA